MPGTWSPSGPWHRTQFAPKSRPPSWMSAGVYVCCACSSPGATITAGIIKISDSGIFIGTSGCCSVYTFPGVIPMQTPGGFAFLALAAAPGHTALFAQSPAVPEKALLDDLVAANRVLAHEIHVLDAYGHVSVRSRSNPNHYYLSRAISAGMVTAADIIEYDLDSKPV